MTIPFLAKVAALVGICILFSNFACAQEQVLTASEVNDLFSDKTFTVTEVEPDKVTGKASTYTVQSSGDGVVRLMSSEFRPEPRIWSVNEDGKFCFTRKSAFSESGLNCGYIVSAGSGVYNMYRVEGKYYPGRKIAGGNRSTHIFSFSDFK